MPLHTEALGSEFEAPIVEVTPRAILAFAAGIGEFNAYTSDDSAPTFVAPKTFCATLEWPPIVQLRQHAFQFLSEPERLRGVHVEQDSIFHGLIRPGDKLRTTARIAALRRTSAGTLLRFLLNTEDAECGTPVVTTHYTTIFRGVDLLGDAPAEPVPAQPPREPETWTSETIIAIPREAAHLYTECSGIWNPIHTERRAALSAGLPDIILHGTALWAIAGRELVRQFAGGNPACLLRLRARFRSPVIPGSTIRLVCASSTTNSGEIHFAIENHSGGGSSVSDGLAIVAPQNKPA